MVLSRLLLALGVWLATCAFSASAQPTPTPSPAPSPLASPSASAAPLRAGTASPAATESPVPKPVAYDAFVKNAKRQSGLIDVLQKDDDVFLDLSAAQLGHPYIVAPVIAGGVGGEIFAGLVYPSFLIEFKRIGKRVLWINLNSNYSATPNSPAQAALDISVADSVLASTPIVAENEETGHIVVSAALFLSDFENLGHDLSPEPPRSAQALTLSFSGRPTFTLDPSKSYIERVKVLPANVEFLVSLAFNGPPDAVVAAPDPRGVVVKMHYSVLELPKADNYVPRLADDRVGFAINARKDFDDDNKPTPFVRYIERWNMDKGPVTFYLSNEIPERYRPVVRRALLQWNSAFAKIGYPHAVQVENQPDDPAWDPDDIRYSTIRWVTSEQPSFAGVASWVVNPLTGEILHAEIVLDGEVVRSIKRGYFDEIALTEHAQVAAPSCSMLDCSYMEKSAELAAAGSLALAMNGDSQAKREQYAEQWLQSVVLHESGHTLGLRHNFAGSTLYALSQLHDRAFTQAHGLVSSVMEYTPVNLSPPGKPQGDYFQLRLGPYDDWAIRYGYAKFPRATTTQDEVPSLRAIAAESTRPEYAYGSDEDAEIWLGPDAMDPMISTFDLSRDPLEFDANQFTVASALVARLDHLYPRDGRAYDQERAAFLTIMRTYVGAAQLSAKYIGGIYTSRAHRGQAGGGAPFRAIPRAQQRAAFDLLSQHIFSSHAFIFSPALLNDLGSNRFLHWDSEPQRRPDFPVTDFVGAIQDQTLTQLFYPDVMMRLADEQLKVNDPHDTMSLADLFGWTQAAIWDDAGAASIAPLHRNLQRRWTSLLAAFALAPSGLVEQLGYPDDSPALARLELSTLAPRLQRALANPALDVPTRAHLADIAHRVNEALTAHTLQSQ